jgi:hypothetical protein
MTVPSPDLALDWQLLVRHLRTRTRGRPWGLSLHDRLRLVCWALRTNLTVRELACLFRVSKSQAHRVLASLVTRISALNVDQRLDRRWSLAVDGTLVPTRDHAAAAKSKNYRWSCNLQVLIRRRDLRVLAVDGGGPGNRNDPVHYRGSLVEQRCQEHGRVLADGGYRGVPELVTPTFRKNRILRNKAWRRHRRRRARVEHAIARLKEWRVLRDFRRRGPALLPTARAVAFLENFRNELRDSP